MEGEIESFCTRDLHALSVKMSEYCDVHTSKTVAQSRCGTTTPPRTPPTTSTIPDQLLVRIQSIHDDLAQVPSLAPGEIVNSLLTRLVDLCIQPYSADCLAQFFSMDNVAELCQSLRSMCARAEGELEAYWASRIIEATKSMFLLCLKLSISRERSLC